MSETAQTADQQKVLEDLGPLEGLPGDARFCCVIGKAPLTDDWNGDPAQRLTAEQVFKKRSLEPKWTGIGLMTGGMVGRLCWMDFDGEEVGKDGVVKTATGDFQTMFLRHPDELPKGPISISGRPGRYRALFRMPEEWCEYFYGFSINSSESPTKAWEFLYEKGTRAQRKCFHAVIEGKHPDGQGWYYRWKEGCSPADLEIPDLPAWFIAGLVRHIAAKAYRRQEREEVKAERSDQEFFDLLSPGKQLKLIRQMEKFWPYRGGPAGTGFAGHWGVMRRLVLSLARGIEDWSVFKDWLEEGAWDLKNDWDGARTSSASVNGGRLLTFAQSLMRSDPTADEVAPWRAAWSLAQENGWKPPKWALPPREFDVNTLAVDVTKKVEQLKEAMQIIEEMESPLDRVIAYQNLTKALDVSPKEFQLILQQAYEEDSGSVTTGGSWEDVIAGAKPVEPAIERLLAFNALTIVGSDGGVGKSVMLYRMAEAAANGWKFAGELETVKGNVLIIQKDESESNLAQKQRLMQCQMPAGAVEVKFRFNGGMLPELRRWIREHEARYVLMDSMISLFGSGNDLNESEIGIYMYQLNKMASEEQCAIVLTHHLRKQGKDKGGKRQDISMADLYGNSFIGAGTSDIWGLIRDPESCNDEPKFLLKVLKPRTGITQGGDTFLLSGSTEDLSYSVEQLNSTPDGLGKLRKGERSILELLRKRGEEKPLSRAELVTHSGMSDATVRRILRELMSTSRFGVKRAPVEGLGNKPRYVYWA